MKQKFNKGDLVRVDEIHGRASDCDAIIIGSYADLYGGSNTSSYSLHIKGKGESAWYEESRLSLIERNRLDILSQWESEKEEERRIMSDLDWIFAHGEEVIKSPHGASVQALASCFGLTNLWGSNGEGFVYYENAMMTLEVAAPFLEAGDKEGWLEATEKIKQEV